MATKASTNFTWEELQHTDLRQFDNSPTPEASANLSLLANEQLEAVRALWNCPVRVNSAYRSVAVNTAIGGAPTSQHCLGCAADLYPLGNLTLKQAMEMVLNSSIQFDQLIYERPNPANSGWIHISRAPHGRPWRRQALMFLPDRKYYEYDPSKIA